MGQVVVVAYRPREGAADALLSLVREHVSILKTENLVTDRIPIIARAADGTLIEVFEWASAAAIEQAHHNRNVQALWERFAQACEYVPLVQLAESQGLFATFEGVEG